MNDSKRIKKAISLYFDDFYAEDANYFGAKPSDSFALFIEMNRIRPCNAMDIGAGEGRNTFYLAEKGFDVTAVEPSLIGARHISSRAASYGGRVTVINEPYLTAGLGDEKFGLIFAVTALDHMTQGDVRKSVDDIKLRLTDGGYVFIVVFTELDPGNTPEKIDASDCAGHIKHYFALGELQSLFADFEILEYVEFSKADDSHGKPHFHHKAKLIARKTRKKTGFSM